MMLTRLPEDIEYLYLERVDWVWDKHGLHIIYDGHHPTTGRRYHIVEEDLHQCVIDNAVVIGIDQFASEGFK